MRILKSSGPLQCEIFWAHNSLTLCLCPCIQSAALYMMKLHVYDLINFMLFSIKEFYWTTWGLGWTRYNVLLDWGVLPFGKFCPLMRLCFSGMIKVISQNLWKCFIIQIEFHKSIVLVFKFLNCNISYEWHDYLLRSWMEL